MKNSIFLLILINFLFKGLLYSQAPSELSKPVDMIGQKAPEFYGVTLTGDTVTNNDFIGRITLLQFMYFPCRPCLLEIPHLNTLSQKYSDRDLTIIAVIPNTPRDIKIYQDGTDTVSVFSIFRKLQLFESSDYTIQYTILPECLVNHPVKPNRIGADCEEISDAFNRNYYPTNYLIDKDGVIRHVFEGFDHLESEKEVKKIEDAILELL